MLLKLPYFYITVFGQLALDLDSEP